MPSRRAEGDDEENEFPDRQRLDKWLVYARFVKTRELAQRLIERGRVRVNSARMQKPDRPVLVDDILTLVLPHGTFVVQVKSVAERRVSPREAQELYVVLSETREG